MAKTRSSRIAAEQEPAPPPPAQASEDLGEESCHLAVDRCGAALTRVELGVMRIQEAFGSWVVELHKQSKGPQLSFQDIALLHCVRLRGGTPTLGEMLIFQHRHDLSSIQYGFKKLESLGLLRKVKAASKREIAYEITAVGRQITDRYAELRSEILVGLCAEIVGMEQAMHEAAAVMERMIGLYDQATQTLLNDHILKRENSYLRAPPSRSRANGA